VASPVSAPTAEPDPSQVDRDDAEPGDPRDLDDAALAEIADLPDVATVIPLVSTRVAVAVPEPVVLDDGTTVTTERRYDRDDGPRGVLFETLVGADVRRADDLPVSVLAGRLPQPCSQVEVAVTPTWLARFGLERADADRMVGLEIEVGAPRSFGEIIRARWMRLKIVGVVAQEATSGGAAGADRSGPAGPSVVARRSS
jgi:hypothetical protein